MRLAALPVFMSATLLAAPVFAQSTGMTGRHNQPAGNSAGSGQSDQQGITADTQQKIRHSLEQNGFKNVQVIPQSFIIRAQSPDGSRVVMEISPDQFEEVVAPSNSGSSTSRSGSSLNNESNPSTGNSTPNNNSTPNDNSTTGNSTTGNSTTGNSTTGGTSR